MIRKKNSLSTFGVIIFFLGTNVVRLAIESVPKDKQGYFVFTI